MNEQKSERATKRTNKGLNESKERTNKGVNDHRSYRADKGMNEQMTPVRRAVLDNGATVNSNT